MKKQDERLEQNLQSVNQQPDTMPMQQQESVPVDQSDMAEQGRQLKEQSDKSPQARAGAKLKAGAKEVAEKNRPQKKVNKTGIPDRLKAAVEHFSGFSLDAVRVHYNSEKPALVEAYAYTEGLDIHIAPGQEKHLAHELQHVVQQMKGEAKATEKVNGQQVDSRKSKEQEADQKIPNKVDDSGKELQQVTPQQGIVQRAAITDEVIAGRLADLGGALTIGDGGNSTIVTRWDSDWGDDAANCHGYTSYGDASHFSYPSEMLASIGADAQVAVFMRGDAIAHSGIYNGGTLTHLLKHIGILESNIGANGTMGYDTRYNLPADRATLDAVLAGAAAAAVAAERRDRVDKVLGYASDAKQDVQEQLGNTYDAAITYDAFMDLDEAGKDAFIVANMDYINRVMAVVDGLFRIETERL
jgi:hypothetical protein